MTRIARLTWIGGGSLFTALLLGIGTFQVVNAMARETVTEVDTVPAERIAAVDVHSPNGSVEVVGGRSEQITVTAEISHGLRRTGHRVVTVGDRLDVRASCPLLDEVQPCTVDYRVEVPATVTVRASTDNGRLVVRDIAGPVRAVGDNGSIELTRVSGDVDATTHNGRLSATRLSSNEVSARTSNGRVSLAFTDPPTRVRARSDNGRVDVVVPERSEPYLVQVDATNGSTDTDVRTDPDSRRSIVAETRNGDVAVRYPTG